MSPSPNRTKLDDLLNGAVDLHPRPDFAAWRQNHPEAVDALQSLSIILSKRRSKMIRIARYSTSVALLLLVAVGMWWMFFGHCTTTAWAQVIDQLARVRNATCQASVHSECSLTYKLSIEGDRIRSEDSGNIYISDFREGKRLSINPATKKAVICDLLKDSSNDVVPGSNPLADLVKLKDAATKQQPDEMIEGITCHVYRVDKPVFLGSKVPWVKLWVNPHSNLPVQVHTFIVDGRFAMTLNSFRWNEPFDKDFMEFTAPKGYELVDERDTKKSQKVREANTMQVAVAAIDAADGSAANPGRELHGEEVTKTLDMLGRRIEANHKALDSWSGTYELAEQTRVPQKPLRTSHAIVDFLIELQRDRIRTDYREILPPQPPVKSATPQRRDEFTLPPVPPVAEAQEWRWVKTEEYSLWFPVNELRNQIDGFPEAGCTFNQAFRVLYHEGPGATHHARRNTFVDPRSFISGEGGLTYRDVCSTYASLLRGKRDAVSDHTRRNLVLRQRRNGTATEYVLLIRYRCSDEDDMSDNVIGEEVFSSDAGFNVVSHRNLIQAHIESSEQCTFRREKGVFIPAKIEFRHYEWSTTRIPTDEMISHRVFTLKQTKVNEPIDPAAFEISSLGLRRGDRLADWVEHRVQVFDGKKFIPVEQFKPNP
jgi:hypothetical protein